MKKNLISKFTLGLSIFSITGVSIGVVLTLTSCGDNSAVKNKTSNVNDKNVGPTEGNGSNNNNVSPTPKEPSSNINNNPKDNNPRNSNNESNSNNSSSTNNVAHPIKHYYDMFASSKVHALRKLFQSTIFQNHSYSKDGYGNYSALGVPLVSYLRTSNVLYQVNWLLQVAQVVRVFPNENNSTIIIPNSFTLKEIFADNDNSQEYKENVQNYLLNTMKLKLNSGWEETKFIVIGFDDNALLGIKNEVLFDNENFVINTTAIDTLYNNPQNQISWNVNSKLVNNIQITNPNLLVSWFNRYNQILEYFNYYFKYNNRSGVTFTLPFSSNNIFYLNKSLALDNYVSKTDSSNVEEKNMFNVFYLPNKLIQNSLFKLKNPIKTLLGNIKILDKNVETNINGFTTFYKEEK